MNSVLKLSLRVLAGQALWFIGIAVFLLLADVPVIMFVWVLSFIVLLSLVSFAGVAWRHVYAIKKIRPDDYIDYLDSHQTRYLELRGSYDELFALCVEAVQSVEGCDLQREDVVVGVIVAKAGALQRDRVEMRLAAEGEGGVVDILCRPNWFLLPFDEGRNLKYMEEIVAYLSRDGEVSHF